MIPTMAKPLLEQEFKSWSPGENPSLLVEQYVDWMSGISSFEEEINNNDVPDDDNNVIRGGEGGGASSTSIAFDCLVLIMEKVCVK